MKVIFCSLLAYNTNSIYRYAAERCLAKLLEQLDEDDVLITYEKVNTDRDEAWRLKPRVIGMALVIAQKDEGVCFVDADIEFRKDFVKRMKEFWKSVKSNKPTLAVTCIWQKGKKNWVPDERIYDYWNRAMLHECEWEFYFGTGMILANKAFLWFIDEWQLLTNKSQYYPEETALVTLVHRHRDEINLVFLPDDLHFVGWHVREVPETAASVHIGSNHIHRWIKAAIKNGGER